MLQQLRIQRAELLAVGASAQRCVGIRNSIEVISLSERGCRLEEGKQFQKRGEPPRLRLRDDLVGVAAEQVDFLLQRL